MQNREGVHVADSWLREAAEANGGDGKFEATETKVRCYCWGKNCFGDRDGIGCWKCVDLAMEEEGELSADVVGPGVCRFDCEPMQLSMYLCGEQAPHHRQWSQEERDEEQAHRDTRVSEGGRSLALF